MRPRIDTPTDRGPFAPHLAPDGLRDAAAVAELFLGIFRRDLLTFFPHTELEPEFLAAGPIFRSGPNFRLSLGRGDRVEVELFGVHYRLVTRDGGRLAAHDLRMVQAIGSVLTLRYHHLFEITNSARLELYRGGSEDHYVAAFVEPSPYAPGSLVSSRIAATIQTLRTAALSTYENQRVSTGALLIGADDDPFHVVARTSPDALPYNVELTGLKSIHRLCDGDRTLFLVDRAGQLSGIVDVGRWAEEIPAGLVADELCARTYIPHARATGLGGHICVVLSPNQEIKLFAEGTQAFAFRHGRWRLLDPRAKFASWSEAVADPGLARTLFGAAMNLAEVRRGALFVVIDDPESAVGRLIAPSDLLTNDAADGPPSALAPGDPLARRAFHYLARGRLACDLDPSVLEALASLDGALAVDRSGRLLAFGAILRHDASDLPGLAAEGARTTAALVASRYGPVLKVSEDGVISCFLAGMRVWDL
ncbi:MAG: hypothetical protein JWN86_3788 [Planctomycetota bacterium]|nr:hypothetical protein [Planctomycetota bacterium]